MKRVMCVYLPAWPLQRWGRAQPGLRDKPIAIADPNALRGPRIVLCSRRARRAGIRPGMPVAEASAIQPDLAVREQDPDGDTQALGQLAEWLARYSPLVGLEEGPFPQSLLLDITGCAPCFRGEDRLLHRAVRELAQEGWTARVALADTMGAAWALAHSARTPLLGPSGETVSLLGPLPVTALRLPPETVQTLDQLGIERIAQLLALEPADLPARFGEAVLCRMEQALGLRPEVLIPHRPPPVVATSLAFEYPTDRPLLIHHAFEQLSRRVEADLRRLHLGARRLECWLYAEAAEPARLPIALCQPSDSARHIASLLRTQLEQTRIAEPLCGMALRVSMAEAMRPLQGEFFESEHPQASTELAALLDRLSSRLGADRVTRAMLMPDPQPEYACRLDPVQHHPDRRPTKTTRPRPKLPGRRFHPDRLPPVPGPRHRPVRLWPAPAGIEVVSVVPEGPPMRFWWKGIEYRIVRARGPERIETGWWRGQDIHRDYYAVVTQMGSRFWIFRRRMDSRWFLHGCFD